MASATNDKRHFVYRFLSYFRFRWDRNCIKQLKIVYLATGVYEYIDIALLFCASTHWPVVQGNRACLFYFQLLKGQKWRARWRGAENAPVFHEVDSLKFS